MKFDKILEYQKIDQELLALEAEVAKSDERKKLVNAKLTLEKATETINKLTQDANDILNGYVAMKTKIDEYQTELDGFDGILEEVQDPTEADYYLKTVASIVDKIGELEKEAASYASRIDGVNEKFKDTWTQGVKASDALKAAKRDYDAFVRELQPKVVAIKTKLEAIKGDIPENLMKAYEALRAAKKMPAFVPYDVKSGNCGRCFMELANDTKSKLRNPGDYAECPNCRRILFVPEN